MVQKEGIKKRYSKKVSSNIIPIKPKTKKITPSNIPVKKIIPTNIIKTPAIMKSSQKNTISPKEITPSFDRDKTVMENFVGLQRVLTNMAEKLDTLSSRMSDLLTLFEVSAKSLAEKGGMQPKGGITDKRLLEKVDNMMEQNRTIARGISLLHEARGQSSAGFSPSMPRKPSYEVQTIKPNENPPQEGTNQYQKSISSDKEKFKSF